MIFIVFFFFFFKQKTAYEIRISDWSSDVCSSDLGPAIAGCYHSHPCGPAEPSARDAAAAAPDGALWLIVGEIEDGRAARLWRARRSEEHTSELQSLMRSSYAVFCLKKKK